MVTLTRNLDFAGSCFLTCFTAIFVARLRQALTWKVRALRLLIYGHHCSPYLKFDPRFVWCRPVVALFVTWPHSIAPQYDLRSIGQLGRLRNRSARPTRIAIGSRRVRISGSFPLVARTATHSPSSKGSDTISKRSPYIFMCMLGMKPRSLILTQLSEPICTMFRHPLRAVLPAVRYSPTAFSVRPIHFCTLPAFFSVFPATSKSGRSSPFRPPL